MKATLKNYLFTHKYSLAAIAASLLAAFGGLVPPEAASLGALLLNTEGTGSAPAGGNDSSGTAGNDGGAVTSASAPSGTPANGAGGTASDKGSSGVGAASAKPESHLPRSKGAAAADRAQAKLAAAKAKPNASSAAPAQDTGTGQPAAGTEGAAGEGKEAAPPGAGEPGQEKPTAGDTPPADSAKAPETWSADRQAKFNTLPTEARGVVLDFHKEMSAGVTHVLTQLSEERNRHQDLFALNERFTSGADGAKEVIAQLAQQAKLEVFFERPAADDKIPDDVLADPVKLAQYIEDRAVKRGAKERQAEQEKTAKESRVRQAQDNLTREFQDAGKAHADFATHKPAVAQLLQKAPSLSVEEAYRLVTYDGMVKLVNEAGAGKQQLAQAQKELADLKKKATQLPAGHGAGQPSGEDKTLSPGQRAAKRAEAKLNARGAHA